MNKNESFLLVYQKIEKSKSSSKFKKQINQVFSKYDIHDIA